MDFSVLRSEQGMMIRQAVSNLWVITYTLWAFISSTIDGGLLSPLILRTKKQYKMT
jgi:hypothetical protein